MKAVLEGWHFKSFRPKEGSLQCVWGLGMAWQLGVSSALYQAALCVGVKELMCLGECMAQNGFGNFPSD